MENSEEAKKEVVIDVGEEEEEGLSHMNHAECDHHLLQASMRKKGSLAKIGEDKSPLVSDDEEIPEKPEKGDDDDEKKEKKPGNFSENSINLSG